MRSFDPDTVQIGHAYLFFYKRRESIHILGSAEYMNEAEAEDFMGGFDNHLQLDNQSKKHSIWHIITSMR